MNGQTDLPKPASQCTCTNDSPVCCNFCSEPKPTPANVTAYTPPLPPAQLLKVEGSQWLGTEYPHCHFEMLLTIDQARDIWAQLGHALQEFN
jgi:hypothetical protein